MINLIIDGQDVQVPEGTTIMQAAETIGVRIPRLCYHPKLSIQGSCRVCIVEVVGVNFFMASCSVKVQEGMEVKTSSNEIRRARRDIIELLLDNHPQDCQTCERNGTCELQRLSYDYGIRNRMFAGEKKDLKVDDSSKSVVREPNKCILCGRCVRVCAEIQGIHNLDQQGRGFNTEVTPAHGCAMDSSVCIQCGQCINACPTAAFKEQYSTGAVWKAIEDPEMHVVFQTAPSIRAAIGEGFGLPVGTDGTGKMVASLRRLGADMVFDTNVGADLTIVEETNEFLDRLQNGGSLPLLTSCSPGWVNFLERFYPEMIPNMSSCRSPMGMNSAMTKTWYAEKAGIDPKKIFSVAVMPCVAKKFEIERPEHHLDGMKLTDAVLTTRELIWMIKCYGIDFANLQEEEFDSPMGVSTGAADIFGSTGGVMEAALRTAVEKVTGEECKELEYTQVRAVEGMKEASLQVGDLEVNVVVANGLTNAKKVFDKVKKGEKQYHIIEIMACPGGCIGGGGQPHPPAGVNIMDPELLSKRAGALYGIDKDKPLRKSHDSPVVKKLYEEYLGEPGSEKAHKLLHTTYDSRLPRGIRK